MGTFELRPFSVSFKNETLGVWAVSPGGAVDNASLIVAIESSNLGAILLNTLPNNGSIGFGVALYIDTDPVTPISSVNDLPPGFICTGLNLKIRVGVDLLTYTGSIVAASGFVDSGELTGTTGSAPNFTYTFAVPQPMPTNVNLLSDILEIACAISAPGIPGFIQLWMTGDYVLANFQYELNPVDGSNVNVGDQVTITSDLNDPDHLQLDQLDIELGDTPVTPETQTEDELTFRVPVGFSGSFIINAIGNGVQFSGTVPLGTLQVLYADASGIYRIVLNKTSDTVYEDSGSGDPTTIDIKIPNPFIKTGYIGD